MKYKDLDRRDAQSRYPNPKANLDSPASNMNVPGYLQED